MRNYVTLNHTGVDKLFPHSLKSEHQTTCFGSALDRYFARQVMCMLYLFRLVGLDGWSDVSRDAPVVQIVVVLPTDMHWYVESSIDRHEKGVSPFDAEHLGAPVRKSTFSVKFSSWIRNPRSKWLLPIEISRALEHAHVISVQVVQGWLCQEFLCVQINEKLRLAKGNGDQGFKNGIDHVQNLSRSMYAFWSFATKSKQFEAIGIRTCSSPLADRPGISGATISAWFTKIPVPLSKLEPAPSNGEYANLNIGWEKLKIYNAMLPCVTSLDSALDQSTYLACAWIPIAVVLRWLGMLASDLVDILRILPHSSCGSIPSSRDLPPPKNDSALKPSPV